MKGQVPLISIVFTDVIRPVSFSGLTRGEIAIKETCITFFFFVEKASFSCRISVDIGQTVEMKLRFKFHRRFEDRTTIFPSLMFAQIFNDVLKFKTETF